MLFMSILAFSKCSANIGSKNKNSPETKRSIETNTSKTYDKKDTLKLNKAGFVFFVPGKSAIDSLKKAIGEDGFETIVEDNTYYNGEAIDFLRKKHLYFANAGSDDLLAFIKKDGSFVQINLNGVKPKWGIYLFNGTDDPVLTSPEKIEDDYKKYFKDK